MFSCSPQHTHDPRVQLLKQSTNTGQPSRSRSSLNSRTVSATGGVAPRSTDQDYNILSFSPPIPPELSELLAVPLHVDISNVYEDTEEIEVSTDESTKTAALHITEDSPESSAASNPNFSRRAYVNTGSYRVGWVVDSERPQCTGCEKLFSVSKRRHHCRGCGDVFCKLCSSYRVPIPELLGESHRVCALCFEKNGNRQQPLAHSKCRV